MNYNIYNRLFQNFMQLCSFGVIIFRKKVASVFAGLYILFMCLAPISDAQNSKDFHLQLYLSESPVASQAIADYGGCINIHLCLHSCSDWANLNMTPAKVSDNDVMFFRESVHAMIFLLDNNYWDDDYFIYYEYNDSLEIARIIRQNYDIELGEWVNFRKTDYVYDTEGLLDEQITYLWSSIYNDWRFLNKVQYQYNEHGRISEQRLLSFSQSSGTWTYAWKDEIFYYDFLKVKSIVTSSWELDSDKWINYQKAEYAYNEAIALEEEVKYNWDAGSQAWDMFFKTKYEYDTSDRLHKAFSYIWLSGNNAWREHNKVVYHYEDNNFLSEWVSYNWKADVSDWIYSRKRYYSYNNNENLSELLNLNYSESTHTWQASTRLFYSYFEYPLNSVFEYAFSDLAVYPNPAKEHISIENLSAQSKYFLYCTSGSLVLSGFISDYDNRISLSGLGQGVYLLLIENGFDKFMKKIIKH